MVIVSITPEIGLEELYTYAGGLGVLEGDKLLEAARRGVEYITLTLFYEKGYVDYAVDEQGQLREVPQEHPIDPSTILSGEEPLQIELRGCQVLVEPLVYRLNRARAVFFRALSPAWAQALTKRVYIEENEEEKLYKYILLAKASAKYIEERIGISDVEALDLQEAYSVLVLLALRNKEKIARIRFITHTPGPWGHPSFPRRLLEEEFGTKLEGEKESITLTLIGLREAHQVFTVSRKHLEITRRLFPRYSDKISYITNGVYIERWLSEALKELLERKSVNAIRLEEIVEARKRAKWKLLDLLQSIEQEKDWKDAAKKPIVVWARRITRYKRPYFATKLIREFPNLADRVFFVLAGKPHPRDEDGLRYLKEFMHLSSSRPNVVYVPSYDIEKAKVLLAGGDYLLFTPFPGWEACGTSYMKAMINGVPPIASRDGGVIEIVRDRVNGFLFGLNNYELIALDSSEAKKIDENDFREFVNTVEKAIAEWNTDKYFSMALEALRSSLSYASTARMLSQYYPWRAEFKNNIEK